MQLRGVLTGGRLDRFPWGQGQYGWAGEKTCHGGSRILTQWEHKARSPHCKKIGFNKDKWKVGENWHLGIFSSYNVTRIMCLALLN